MNGLALPCSLEIVPRKPEWVPLTEVAEQIGVHEATIRRWIRAGLLEKKASRSGGPRRVLVDLHAARAVHDRPPPEESPAAPPPPGDVRPVRLLLLEEAVAMFGRSAEELEKMAKARRIVMWTRLDDGTRYVEYESARRELAD